MSDLASRCSLSSTKPLDSNGAHEEDPLIRPSVVAPRPNHDELEDSSKPSLDKFVLYFMAIHFLLAFCQIILVAPLLRLFENSICLTHYNFPAGGVQESICKIPEIQAPLATIRGWKSTLDTIPVFLVAIPLGRTGDRYGRRKILALSLIGVAGSLVEIFIVCAFPRIFSLRLVWLSSLLLLCGGGLNSASAFMWAYAAETIPSERRSHAFYYIFSAFYVAELIASFLAAMTMNISPWLPSFLALGSVVLGILLLWIVPKPPKSKKDGSMADGQEEASHLTRDSEERQLTSEETGKYSLLDDLKAVAAISNVLLVIPVFLVGIFRYTTLDVLIQYASNRFGLKISTGAIFYTETAALNIVLFLFLIPQGTEYLRKKHNVLSERMDLFLARSSVILMCLGSLAIGLAPLGKLLPFGVAVFAAGFGSRVSALSLVSYWIPDGTKATMYATITVLESLGHAIGDPAMQQIFASSLKLPPFWHAMPFFFAAGLYFLAVVSTSLIRPEKHRRI